MIVTIDLDHLEEVRRYLARLESVPLEDVCWMRAGRAVPVTPEQVAEWKFTGLNNRDFAEAHLGK